MSLTKSIYFSYSPCWAIVSYQYLQSMRYHYSYTLWSDPGLECDRSECCLHRRSKRKFVCDSRDVKRSSFIMTRHAGRLHRCRRVRKHHEQCGNDKYRYSYFESYLPIDRHLQQLSGGHQRPCRQLQQSIILRYRP